ncbi:MAG: SpoIID/LytB domain-containing protein [Schwartzia sp.]|nr:SpoIID/LytB domain-containing protein [Schwartzia sp. (in: firmicutes)]
MRKTIRAGVAVLLAGILTAAPVLAAPREQEPAKKGTPAVGAAKPDTTAKKAEPVIQVGLATEQVSAAISANGAYVVRDEATGQGLLQCPSNQTLTVTLKNRQMVLNGKGISARRLRIQAADERSSTCLHFAGHPYRGALRLELTADGLTVVNEVKLDDYIGGVIDEEMAPGWPREALRAQAVAARTFALYSRGKHNDEGFDVCTGTHCQVYGGIESESPTGLAAVSSTRGEVMMYGGKPIYAAFHASSGGCTAGSEETGGNPVPYLKPVRDDDSASPRHNWQQRFPVAEVQAKLKAAGFDIGALKSAVLSPLDDRGKPGVDRFPSGRVRTVRFTGARGTAEVAGTKLRWTFGLPSTLFELRHGTNGKVAANPKGSLSFSGKAGEELVFDGHGAGHGLGLSQWGAYAMAAKKDYKTILHHYYTGIEIRKLY